MRWCPKHRWAFLSFGFIVLVPFLLWLSDHLSFMQELMRTSVEKSHFLCLAYQMQVGGTTDHGCLDAVEAEVQR